jgi:putative ABC transport system permease protein
MKYWSLIWANLWRKPLRTIFTFVSVVLGFTLLGLVLGLNASFRHVAEVAHADRIYTAARYNSPLHIAQRQQISGLTDVRNVAALDSIVGYYQRPGINLAVLMLDREMQKVFVELPLTAAQWAVLSNTRDGVFASNLFATRYGLKAASSFAVISPNTHKSDGSDVWAFNLLGIVPDIPLMPVGFAVGNYDYLDQARPEINRGEVKQFWLLAKDGDHADQVVREIDNFFASSAVPTKSVSERALLEETGSGNESALVLKAIALVGMIMIAVVTVNALAHSIRERIGELAILKTIGFPNRAVVTLVTTEAALPCLSGCLTGLALAAGAAAVMPAIVPPEVILPIPSVDFEVVCVGVGAALLIAAIAVAVPALRISRLDVATALARR